MIKSGPGCHRHRQENAVDEWVRHIYIYIYIYIHTYNYANIDIEIIIEVHILEILDEEGPRLLVSLRRT